MSSTSASWIGYQILQGLGCGLAAQIPLLTIQLVLKDEPRSIPVGIATVLFTQYFGSAVMQSIGGAIFQNALRRQLHQASLVDKQIEMLLNAGTSRVREVAVQAFPDRLADIIVAYNNAITPVFMSQSFQISHLHLKRTLLTLLVSSSSWQCSSISSIGRNFKGQYNPGR